MTDSPMPTPLLAAALSGLGRVRHGFFTRQGGASGGLYASLNCGPGSGDDRGAVSENRARVGAALGVAPGAVVTAYQVHSPDVVRVDAPWNPASAPKADALVTDRPGIAVGVLTADCAPILFADADAGVVGAAHAGWKGAIGGVVEATVEAMTKLGARASRISAAVGPAIGPASYEVGPEFRDRFVGEDAANAVFFRASTRAGHHLFDLPAYVGARLGRIGLGAVEVLARDTRAEAGVFFSYRRATLSGEPDYGRQLSAIALGDGGKGE